MPNKPVVPRDNDLDEILNLYGQGEVYHFSRGQNQSNAEWRSWIKSADIEDLIKEKARFITWDEASRKELNLPKNSIGVLNGNDLATAIRELLLGNKDKCTSIHTVGNHVWKDNMTKQKKEELRECPVHNDTRCYCDDRPDFFSYDCEAKSLSLGEVEAIKKVIRGSRLARYAYSDMMLRSKTAEEAADYHFSYINALAQALTPYLSTEK